MKFSNLLFCMYFVGIECCLSTHSRSYLPSDEIFVPKINCGLSPVKNIFSRIVNGKNITKNSYPWTVSLAFLSNSKFYHFCGGSIVSSQFIITAAHCVDKKNINEICIITEPYLVSNNPDIRTVYSIKTVFKHPLFNNVDESNDIALIQSNRVFEKNSTLPICLPVSTNISPIYSQEVIVTGWFRIYGNNTMILNEALMNVINGESICANYDSGHYCVLDKSGKLANICKGDSGSALMYHVNGNYYLYGVANKISGVNEMCKPEEPSFYTKVPLYLKWILDVLEKF